MRSWFRNVALYIRRESYNTDEASYALKEADFFFQFNLFLCCLTSTMRLYFNQSDWCGLVITCTLCNFFCSSVASSWTRCTGLVQPSMDTIYRYLYTHLQENVAMDRKSALVMFYKTTFGNLPGYILRQINAFADSG